MRFNTYISSLSDITACANAINVGEVLIEPALLAREGQLTMDKAVALAQAAADQGLRPILVWDALMPQRVLDETLGSLDIEALSQFAAVRVSDPGVAYWLFEEQPRLAIQYIVETGSHNLEALTGWQEVFGSALERFVLSIELPEEKLVEYCRTLSVDCEVLGVGRILLFYSPRSLIAQHLDHSQSPGAHSPPSAHSTPSAHAPFSGHSPELDTYGPTTGEPEHEEYLHLDATVRPQKSLNRAFPTLETIHGTFMYLDKDQFILDRLDQLRQAGLAMLRIDLRHLSSDGSAASSIDQVCGHIFDDPGLLRREWPRPTRAPFFKNNRTTAQFSRMKSFLHELRDERCLAEIIGGDNGKYVVYQTLRNFAVTEVENIVLPTGEEVEVPSRTVFRSQDGNEIRTCSADQIIVSGWIKKSASGALLTGRSGSAGANSTAQVEP